MEIVGSPAEGHSDYYIRSGHIVFSTIARPNNSKEPPWEVYPECWIGQDMLEKLIHRDWKMKNAALVAKERLQGLPVEHWRGRNKSGGTIDLWLSTSPRFPLVLKMQSQSAKSSLLWEITNLRLNEPVPDSILTPQIHPKSGLLAQFRMQYRPLWMILLQYALLLAAFA